MPGLSGLLPVMVRNSALEAVLESLRSARTKLHQGEVRYSGSAGQINGRPISESGSNLLLNLKRTFAIPHYPSWL